MVILLLLVHFVQFSLDLARIFSFALGESSKLRFTFLSSMED